MTNAARQKRKKSILTLLERRFPDVTEWAGFDPIEHDRPAPAVADVPEDTRLASFHRYASRLRQFTPRRLQAELEAIKAGAVEPLPDEEIEDRRKALKVELQAVENEYFRQKLQELADATGKPQRRFPQSRRPLSTAERVRILEHKLLRAERRADMAETREAEAKALMATMARQPNAAAANKARLNPKTQRTYQKLILGMALAKFQYRPGAANSAPELIRGALHREGIKLDVKTIRDRLAEAATSRDEDGWD